MRGLGLTVISLFLWIGLSGAAEPEGSWIDLHDRSMAVSLAQAEAEAAASPEEFSANYILAVKYLEEFRWDRARPIFERLQAARPDCYLCAWGWADVESNQHRFAPAKTVLNDLIKQYPDFAPAYISLTKIAYMSRDWEEMIRLTAKVIRKGKDRSDRLSFAKAHAFFGAAKGMLFYFGGPWAKLKNGYASVRHLKIVAKLVPGSDIYYFSWGNYLAVSPKAFGGDLDKAQEYFLKTIALKPYFADAYARLAQVYRKKGDNKLYEEYLAKALAIDSQNELALDVKAHACRYICLEAVE
jgi:tetratricopeptide (TPR) repeat protein